MTFKAFENLSHNFKSRSEINIKLSIKIKSHTQTILSKHKCLFDKEIKIRKVIEKSNCRTLLLTYMRRTTMNKKRQITITFK